jgi:protein kinase-like protein
MAAMAEPTDRDAPESTVEYVEQVETVDVLGPKAREGRERRPGELAVAATNDAERVKIGRYQLLEMAGAGGMGLVWSAWDPELERRVALKLVRWSSPGSRERMLREGQVLAQLSHPNIVPIFDVGIVDEQLYLIMEWIRGETMRAFGARAGEQAELLDVYRQAGEGLAAAHRAGVIHRDFKPDNAIVGDDGRVRVLDFGLALRDDDDAPAVAGTPRYMSPEQSQGGEVSAAGDQYAFCVSLREALGLLGAVPGWIAAIIERGTEEDPAKRWESMEALLGELRHDPARRRRRLALGVGAVVAAVGAFAIGRSGRDETAAVEACSGAPAEIATSWSAARRATVVANLRAVAPADDPERVARQLDGYATRWADEHRRTCLANQRNELTPNLYQDRLRCLARARSQLATIGELLAGVKLDGLTDALRAARSLPDVTACADDRGIEPPPLAVRDKVDAADRALDRALVLALAHRPEALELANRAARDAATTGYGPLIARAELVAGRAVMVTNGDATGRFDTAMHTALRASDDVTAVEAYARWIYALPEDQAVDDWPVMVDVAERLGRPGRVARALMYNNYGLTRMSANDFPAARELFERARGAAGDAPDIELTAIPQNLAQITEDTAAAESLVRAARDRLAAALGENHFDTVMAGGRLAFATRPLGRAREMLEAACHGLERLHDTIALGFCAYEAAWLADQAGDDVAARAWMKRVTEANVPVVAPIAAAYQAVATNAPDREQRIAALRSDSQKAATAAGTGRGFAADALVIIARRDATAWARALVLLESIPIQMFQRRLARARATVARSLAATNPGEARRLASLALVWYDGTDETEQVRALRAITSAGSSSR